MKKKKKPEVDETLRVVEFAAAVETSEDMCEWAFVATFDLPESDPRTIAIAMMRTLTDFCLENELDVDELQGISESAGHMLPHAGDVN